MTALTRRFAALLAVALACVLPLGSAQATSTTENTASALIEQDDGRAFDFAWDIDKRRGDDAVLHRNSAKALARCLRCKATAIAFQIVLITGSPQTVVPVNVAEAVNDQCTDCVAVAEARQFVRVVPTSVRFTSEGRAVLADVRRDLAALEDQDLPADQLHQAVETQEARVREALGTELVQSSDPDTEARVTEREFLQSADVG